MHRSKQKGFTIVELVITIAIVVAILSFAVYGVVGYVAVHFISKVW